MFYMLSEVLLVNEISEKWAALQDTEKEHALFDAYASARTKYLEAIRNLLYSKATKSKVVILCKAERDAFSAYLSHRTRIKPEGSQT